jgi:hypothetical protein
LIGKFLQSLVRSLNLVKNREVGRRDAGRRQRRGRFMFQPFFADAKQRMQDYALSGKYLGERGYVRSGNRSDARATGLQPGFRIHDDHKLTFCGNKLRR